MMELFSKYVFAKKLYNVINVRLGSKYVSDQAFISGKSKFADEN